MAIPSGLPNKHVASSLRQSDQEGIRKNTQEVLPQSKIEDLLPKPHKIAVHEDDLVVHQDRIDAIDANLNSAGDIAQQLICHVGDELQKKGYLQEKPQLNHAVETLVRELDKARNQAAHGEFDLAKRTCEDALREFESRDFESELLKTIDEKVLDKEGIKTFLDKARKAMHESIGFANGACKDCELYLADLNKAATVELPVIEKAIVEQAFKELHEARASLQKIWDGKEPGDVEQAKAQVRKASQRCRDLSWVPGNAVIAKKAMIGKAQLAASLIPKSTAEKLVVLATTEFGTIEKPGTVLLGGRQYEVAHSLIDKGHQIVHLPQEEQILGKGAWNVVYKVTNVSNTCFQALRKPITPPGAAPIGEEQIQRSIQIYKDIRGLKGTTMGPEAIIRGGTGGILTSKYSDDVIKWLQMMPPTELRWENFKSSLNSFIEFARAGNVHGDLHPGNFSVVYDNKRVDKGGRPIHAAPGTIKIEDLDGACHIVQGYDAQGNPIFNKNAADAGIVCKFATQREVDRWVKSIGDKDLPNLAEVRFGQDILAMGITLYQILTLDFNIDNLYLNKECSPFTDEHGNVVPGKFEEGIFTNGKPNLEAVRFALEDYQFLTKEQKDQVVKFIASAITQNPQERARLQDLEAAMNI